MKNRGVFFLAMVLTLGLVGAASGQCIDNLADGLGPAFDTAVIGETVEYTITLSVPESPDPPAPPNCTLVNVDLYFFPPPLGAPAGQPCEADPAGAIPIDSGLTLIPGGAPYVYTSADNAALSYVVQPGDAGGSVYAHIATYFNTADNPTGDPLCDEKESEVVVECPPPCVEITKEVDCEWSKVGDWVTYTICVENCGTEYDLTDVVVTDDVLGGPLAFPTTLEPGIPVCEEFQYQIQLGDDTGEPGATLVNTASVSAVQICGETTTPVSATSLPVTVTLLHPDFAVTKDCLTPQVPQGGEAEFEIVITNTGDVDLMIITDEPEISGDPPVEYRLVVDEVITQSVFRPCEDADEVCNTIHVTATIPEEYCALPNVIEDEATACCECPVGENGCTPGFWKNHPDCWCETYEPGDRVDSVFTIPAELTDLADDSLMDALNYKGGGGIYGAARILLRAAVSAVLNACHDNVAYPMGETAVINAVNDALATLDRQEMLGLGLMLDEYNNLGCSIDAHCRPIEDADSFLPVR